MPSLRTIGLASLAAVSTLASAHPAEKPSNPNKRWSEGDPGCMTWDDAQAVVNNWKALITDYSDEVADRSVTVGFTDYSESVNTLINTCPQGDAAKPLPLLMPTFSNRAEFKEAQGQQPPINFEQLQMWHTCSSVTARWKTTNTAPPSKVPDVKPVVGIFVLETVPVGDAFKIERAYSEFDAGAWLQNLQDWGICGMNADAVANPTLSIASSAAPVAAVVSTPPAAPVVAESTPVVTSAAPAGTGSMSAPAVEAAYGNSTTWAA